MYSFLSAVKNKVLDQIPLDEGFLELDFANEDHYRFFMEQVGGLECFNQKHPELAPVLQKLKSEPLRKATPSEAGQYRNGPTDNMVIENLMFKKPLKGEYSPILGDSFDGTTMAKISADYINKKDHISVVTQLYDVTQGIQLLSVVEDVNDTSKYNGNVRADYPKYIQNAPREFMIHSTFYAAEKTADDLYQLKGYVTKAIGFELKANNQIIKSFTLNAPVIRADHRNIKDHTEVKIAYRREGNIPDYDYSNDDQPFKDGQNTKILVRVPFSITVEACPKWWISGVDEKYGFRMWLSNMVNGTVNNYCNFDQIVQKQDAFDDQNRCIKMTVTFPDDWKNILDFSKVGYVAYTDVDFYAGLGMVMSCADYDMTVGVSAKSGAVDYDLLNIESKKIFIQWGCIARDTQILMADGQVKRADAVMIGDRLRNATGGSSTVKTVLSGTEETLYQIVTTNHTVKMTYDHTVLTTLGLLPAKDVKPGMFIQTQTIPEQVLTIEEVAYNDKVFNFEFDEETVIIGNSLMIGDSLLQKNIKELTSYEY